MESPVTAQKKEAKNSMEDDGGAGGGRSNSKNVKRGESNGLKQSPLETLLRSPMLQRKEQNDISRDTCESFGMKLMS